jgi:hypothetical protein
MSTVTGYKQGDKFIVAAKGIIPIPMKYQTGPVKFSNNPCNRIQGLEKLNNLKVK